MYTFVKAPLTNDHYGDYGGRPHGSERRVKPKLLICIHITSNDATAVQERNYANHTGDPLRSAHDYMNRDGSIVAAINPVKYAAWSNGDLKSPNTGLQIVKTILAERAKGFNPNEVFYREVECCGKPDTAPITAAQEESLAQLIAQDSNATGIPISRATVGTHADINSETRNRCAWVPASRTAALARIIKRANALLAAHKIVAAGTLTA